MTNTEFAGLVFSPWPTSGFVVGAVVGGEKLWVKEICYDRMQEIRYTAKKHQARPFTLDMAKKLRVGLHQRQTILEPK